MKIKLEYDYTPTNSNPYSCAWYKETDGKWRYQACRVSMQSFEDARDKLLKDLKNKVAIPEPEEVEI